MARQGAHKVSLREATIWFLVWIAVSFMFVGPMVLSLIVSRKPGIRGGYPFGKKDGTHPG